MSLLFDLGRKPPTTKMIALQLREHGAESLDEAHRRADQARYQEITCRSALNPVKGMPFAWTLNPYRGCTHACHYCFARRYQTQFELGPGDEFSSLILVKVNLVDVLKRELDKPSWLRETVAIGTAIDLLVALSHVTRCTVCMSVPTVNEEAWAALEPGTAHPMQRLRAVQRLR